MKYTQIKKELEWEIQDYNQQKFGILFWDNNEQQIYFKPASKNIVLNDVDLQDIYDKIQCIETDIQNIKIQ